MKSTKKRPSSGTRDKMHCQSTITGKYLRSLVSQGFSGEVTEGWWHNVGFLAINAGPGKISFMNVKPVWN